MKELLTPEEIKLYIRKYRKSLLSRLPNDSTVDKFFSKIIINTEMYKELISGFVIPKGHVVTFDGLPVEPADDIIYGSIIYFPKFLTVEVGKNVKTLQN